MAGVNIQEVYKARLGPAEFRRLSQFIMDNYGIQMPETKKILLEGRLQKRLLANGFSNFKEYVEFLFSETGKKHELVYFIDVVSTNKTDFFREPHHFEFLSERYLPEYVKQSSGPLRIWSSAASSGEELYTIAMVINEFILENHTFPYEILGTDISQDILRKAVKAVYASDRVGKIPLALKRKYFLKSKDPQNTSVRVVPELRKKTRYQILNLLDTVYNVPNGFDILPKCVDLL